MPTESWAALMAKAEVPQGGSGKILPKGTYRVEIKNVKISNPRGKDKVSLLLEIIEGPEKGEKIWDNWTISPDSPVALGIFFQNLERCGGSLETLTMGGSLEQATKPMVGQVRDVSLDIEEYPKGQEPPALRNKTGFYRIPFSGEASAAATPSAGTSTSTAKSPF